MVCLSPKSMLTCTDSFSFLLFLPHLLSFIISSGIKRFLTIKWTSFLIKFPMSEEDECPFLPESRLPLIPANILKWCNLLAFIALWGFKREVTLGLVMTMEVCSDWVWAEAMDNAGIFKAAQVFSRYLISLHSDCKNKNLKFVHHSFPLKMPYFKTRWHNAKH